MYFPIEVEDIELVGCGADIPFFVPVGLEDSVYLADQEVMPDIELSFFVEERAIYV
jgi:hypothetical protein